MNTRAILLLAILPLAACAQKSEWALLSTSEKSETAQLANGTEEKRQVIVLDIACPSKFPGPVHLKIEVRSPKGDILTDVMPAFGVTDTKQKRTVYLYIKESDIQNHIGAVFSASISSEGFSPIYIQHQFKKDGA